jgi:hypothetical protein
MATYIAVGSVATGIARGRVAADIALGNIATNIARATRLLERVWLQILLYEV